MTTTISVEKAVEVLGCEMDDLREYFRIAAADELARIADRVRRGHPMEGIQRARNLLRVAEAAEKVILREIEAEEATDPQGATDG